MLHSWLKPKSAQRQEKQNEFKRKNGGGNLKKSLSLTSLFDHVKKEAKASSTFYVHCPQTGTRMISWSLDTNSIKVEVG